ncbi:hypothetical protein [Actinoplanes sp. NPDC049802]|uniref:hypothetical protein n=1 Tax=Actinoplanes sp. NPDC049802 TaxID=3154742 RepID=UPI00340355E2
MPKRPEVPARTLKVGQTFYPDGDAQVITKITMVIEHKSPGDANNPDIETATTNFTPDYEVEV